MSTDEGAAGTRWKNIYLWLAAFVMAVAVYLMAAGDYTLGGILAIAALIVAIFVYRRGARANSGP